MGFIDLLSRSLRRSASDFLSEIKEEVALKTRIEIKRIERQVVYKITSLFVLLTALLFFLFSVLFFFIEYLQLSRTISFLIIAVLLVIVVVILKAFK